MLYEAPQNLSTQDIVDILQNAKSEPNDVYSAVISAIYYGDTVEFSGDSLMAGFLGADTDLRMRLLDLFETFHQMCWTSYRIDEGIEIITQFKYASPENALEIAEALDSLTELKEMIEAG